MRSLKLDSWSDIQIQALELGGNKRFLTHVQLYSQQKGISCIHVQLSLNKYFIPEVLFYRYSYYSAKCGCFYLLELNGVFNSSEKFWKLKCR